MRRLESDEARAVEALLDRVLEGWRLTAVTDTGATVPVRYAPDGSENEAEPFRDASGHKYPSRRVRAVQRVLSAV